MKTSTKVILGGGLVLGTGLAVYTIKNRKQVFEFEEMLFDTKEDAETVLKELNGLANKYDFVTVADYFDLLGTPVSYVANTYGWNSKSLAKAKLKKYRGRNYTIKFPRVEELK
jgi:hypothetical protein